MKIVQYMPIGFVIAVLAISGCSSGSGKDTASAGPVKLANNYYRFNPAEYQKALSDGKIVMLFFKANWCPNCIESEKAIIAVFSSIDYKNVVGFQIHYNDDESKDFDDQMIRKYQVVYQDALVILDKNGKESSRFLANIIEERIKFGIEKAEAS